MASFIGDLQQARQQAQDADAYRALVRQMEDDSLARNAVAKSRAEYDNADMGYGLTRADIARAIGRPTSEVSIDTLGDQELQQLGAAKMADQRAVYEAASSYSQPRDASPAMVQDIGVGRLGLAGQMSGRGVNPDVADRFVNSIPNPGSVDMNANRYTPGTQQVGEVSDVMPNNDQEIRDLKRKGAY